MSAARPAAFLDRDGTIIEDRDYLGDPDGVVLLAGAADAIARLNAAGVLVVVVTNQSGIARGLLSEADYRRVESRLTALLAERGARVDATYFCPHLPEITGPCACRKPGTLLYEQAVAAHGIDPGRSVFVGDRWRDVAPARQLGGRGILVPGPSTPAADLARAAAEAEVAPTLSAAVAALLGA